MERRRKNRDKISWGITIISIIIATIVFFCRKKVTIPELDELYNLLTINTIFAGFLYSMLGNMVEFSMRPEVKERDKAGYIESYFSPIYFGLFFFLISIVIEVLLIFFNFKFFMSFFIYAQTSTSLIGIVFFIYSTIRLRKMISNVRNH
ncbi:hypothetical protein [Enterococcus lactis]|uniref:hypothetical protein n=1 Tax=Enterococcus lactis TaxID=357441 RepID=UPI0034CD63D5